ncbi:MAG: hemerythrin domain-containing protein [Alphaproteobacteria bacterium]|nr:hemerythrin domain-containing protein [Alphaproteobacteria bacterium]
MEHEGLDPSEVRARVLSEHEAIRERLRVIEGHAERVREEPTLRGPLQHALIALVPVVRAHADFEDVALAPALLEADAFGDVRTDRLAEHHERLRADMERLEAELGDGEASVASLLAWSRWMTLRLREDMADEERHLLRPDILRDDIVTSGLDG